MLLNYEFYSCTHTAHSACEHRSKAVKAVTYSDSKCVGKNNKEIVETFCLFIKFQHSITSLHNLAYELITPTH